MQIANLTTYQYVPLVDLEALRSRLWDVAATHELRGTILLSPEGINLNLAGLQAGIDAFIAALDAEPDFEAFDTKTSFSDFVPYQRLNVKIKPEIITFKQPKCSPLTQQVDYVTPSELKTWLDQGHDVTVLDTRNRFELEYGKFTQAIDLAIDAFTELPAAAAQLPEAAKQKPLVMYCTGGVRCEKAGLSLQQQGFNEVYQLEGGILKYFQECGGDHYSGDCFVFDERITVAPEFTSPQTTQA